MYFLFSSLAAQSAVLDKTMSQVMKNEVPVKKVFTILVLGRNSLEYFLPSYTESLASS